MNVEGKAAIVTGGGTGVGRATALALAVREEIAGLAGAGPTEREMERVLNQIEVDFVEGLERVGGFGGKADQLNRYYMTTGNPGYVRKDLARYSRTTAETVAGQVRGSLLDAKSVVLSVVPRGRTDLVANRVDR